MTVLTWKVLAFCLLLLCGVTVTFALGSDTAKAQESNNDYVDVGITLEIPTTTNVRRYVDITVANYGARTAYDVEIVADIVYPENSSHWLLPEDLPAGSATLENSKYRFRWTHTCSRGTGMGIG